MTEGPPPVYEFGDFRLDAARRQLVRRDGEPVPLSPKAFDTLQYMVEHGGELLGREELMAAVWPDAAVEPNNLDQSISALRRALGERRDAHTYIVTVPGRGYRFAADVKRGAGRAATAAAPPEKTIAVLPFLNMSDDAENEYFCDGLAEELLNALAKVEGLKVAARTSAFSFKGKNTNVGEIGRALGVRAVLEGSVRKSGSRLRITVQLIDAADGYHLWSERYDREMRDIFDVQDEITLAVVDALKVRLLGAEKAAVLKRHTENAEAYQLYLKGRYYWFKGTPEGLRMSRDFFQRAIDLDPTYALGYVGLGDYYGYCTATGLLPPEEGWPRASSAWAKALELDDTLPEVRDGPPGHKLFYYRDWAGAERVIKRAIESNPNFAEWHVLYPFCLVAMGRLDEAVAEGRRAVELDPLSARNRLYLGNWLYHARRYDEAVRQYRDALELDPNDVSVHELLGDVYERQGLHEEAAIEWQKALMLAGDEELAALLGQAHAGSDFAGAVRAVTLKRLERLGARAAGGEYVPAIEYARAYVRLGDLEQAFRWLDKAGEERNVFPLMFGSDPFYDSIRADPRFADLMRRVGLPQ